MVSSLRLLYESFYEVSTEIVNCVITLYIVFWIILYVYKKNTRW
jgi:hypothetical protein